jgi:hypothetical protein
MKPLHLFFFTALFITGCMEATIDTSSEESLENSMATVRNSLDQNKQQEFDKAVGVVTLAHVKDMLEPVDNPIDALKKIPNALDGKTADEIIAEANRIQAEQKKEKGPKFSIGIGNIDVHTSLQRNSNKDSAKKAPNP